MDEFKTKIVPCAWALLLAVFILYFVNFAPDEFHNAAHDVRYAVAIPCH